MTLQALISQTPTVFGTGDGVTTVFPLTDGDETIFAQNISVVFKQNWQGFNQLSTGPRSNLAYNPTSVGGLGWGTTNLVVSTNNVIAPDGTKTANFIAETAVTGNFDVLCAPLVPAGLPWTFSIFVLPSTRTAVQMFVTDSGGSSVAIDWDLSLGQLYNTTTAGGGSVQSTSITPYPNGWYYLTVSGTLASAITQYNVQLFLENTPGTISYAGTAGYGLWVWGAQFELGSVATPLILNPIGTSNGQIPLTVIDYAITSQAPRTNLLSFANSLTAPSWAATLCTPSALPNGIYGPDSTTNAWLVTLSLSDTNSYLTNTSSSVNLAGRTVTASVFLRLGTLSTEPFQLWIRDGAGTNVGTATFDMAAYVPAAGLNNVDAPTMQWWGGGWWLCTFSTAFPTSAAKGLIFIIDPTDTSGNSGQTYYVAYPQVEYGINATPFINTSLLPVTVPGTSVSVGAGYATFQVPPEQGSVLSWEGTIVYTYNAEGDDLPLWESTVLSQYANSPILMQLIYYLEQYFDPTANINAFYTNIWNIYTAQGYGLDVWGRIVGVSRILNVGAASYFGFENASGPLNASGDSFGGGPAPTGAQPWYSGQTTTNSFALSDNAYRTLILAKAFANICNSSIPAINQILINLFITPVPGRSGNFYCTDTLNKVMTYTAAVRPVLTPVEVAIISQSGVLPKPTGVSTTLVQI